MTPTTTVMEAKWSCDSRAADGSCNKMTCVSDSRSDCAAFKYVCEHYGDNQYSGSASSGTCSRVL